MTRSTSFDGSTLTWVLGIEDTCVYPAHDGAIALDEHHLTDHDRHWRDDLELARRLGSQALRYGMSWPLVHLAPGRFDWRHLDEVIGHAVDEVGLDIVADLVHYGTPSWLAGSFADPQYPAMIEEFASALAHRYAGRIRAYTPLNEPVTTASFCGLRAVWPPYRRGWDGWTSVAVPIAVGMARATQAIRQADSAALVVHVEAATAISSTEPDAQDEAALLEGLGWLPTDLLVGKVDTGHALRAWLITQGASVADLDWLLSNPATPDIMGVNYYPDLTPRRLRTVAGRHTQVAYHGGSARLEEVLRAFSERYRLPLAVTETSIEGDDRVRAGWLRDASEVVARLGEELDIRAFTWWPLFDFVDWSWATEGANVEEFGVERSEADGSTSVAFAEPLGHPRDGKTPFLRRMGLVRLDEDADGGLIRNPTEAAREFSRLSEPSNLDAVSGGPQ